MAYQDPQDQFPRTRAYDYPGQQPPSQPQQYVGGTGQWEQAPRTPMVSAPAVNPVLFVGGVLMTGVVVGLAVGLVAWILEKATANIDAVHLGDSIVLNYVITGFVIAIFAAAFWYVLQLITPAPGSFFAWIGALLLIAAVVAPMLIDTGDLATAACRSLLHLVIGVPILGLIPMVGSQSKRR
ncbi:hypothetical protein [Gordonia sp. (in: high G+C Gram-positive bacteria)]|uniref:hypothetical protein n=1 Tax=Gordonia sp. (in: high G+C Gram-positive bacteria) TaxID=84139 RepID=UPI0039E339E1